MARDLEGKSSSGKVTEKKVDPGGGCCGRRNPLESPRPAILGSICGSGGTVLEGGNELIVQAAGEREGSFEKVVGQGRRNYLAKQWRTSTPSEGDAECYALQLTR